MQTSLLVKYIVAISTALIPALLNSQTTSDGSMPQYYFQEFNMSKVIMKNGQVQTPNLNYNTVTEKMVFIRDGKYYDISNPGMVDTVIIRDVKFIPVGDAFYEVLIASEPALLLQYKGEILPAGKPVGYGGTSQLSSSVYLSSVDLSGGRYNLPIPSDYIVKVEPVYWIRKPDGLASFINEKQFLSLFQDKSDLLKNFIRKNRIKIDRKEHVIKLVNYCNSLAE
ncbi:MAG TPA: hypothetical protein PLB27_03360 [Bacteroidales bacterium]|nr:hypothetical protein [Bacteroidales bacterium]